MASTEIEFQPTNAKKPGPLGRAKNFFYDPETKQICGRTGASWGKITAFYLVYYGCLAGFFAACLALFFTTVDNRIPSQTGMDSLIKGNPGVAFRPMPSVESTLIKFKQAKDDTYKVYTQNIQALLSKYQNEQKEYDYQDCVNGEKEDGNNKPCKFDLALLGDKCSESTSFGYYSGQPCILFKMNKVYGWEPVLYTNETIKDAAPASVAENYTPGGVGVSCEGENPGDVDNLGAVEVYPPKGFLAHYFPYDNSPGYQAPLVFVRLANLESGVITQVWCKAWAENIYHHKNDKAGSAHFEILMD